MIGRSGFVIAALALLACDRERPPAAHRPPARQAAVATQDAAIDDHTARRTAMVETQIERRGVADPRVLAAMRTVPRHEFVPVELADRAYEDRPLPIGRGQTISQPYVVAAMTELARVDRRSRVLEIGTGSGYQAAVLAEIVDQLYSIEIDPVLAARAADTLDRLGYERVHVRAGDGYQGWPDAAPFDAIVVTAAPPQVPAPLRAQLAVGGRMVIPVGDDDQQLLLITRTGDDGFVEERVFPVMFVPMTGEAQEQASRRD